MYTHVHTHTHTVSEYVVLKIKIVSIIYIPFHNTSEPLPQLIHLKLSKVSLGFNLFKGPEASSAPLFFFVVVVGFCLFVCFLEGAYFSPLVNFLFVISCRLPVSSAKEANCHACVLGVEINNSV